MQRKISVRVLASLIVSLMLFVLPIGALLANRSMTTTVFAEGSASDDNAEKENTDDNCPIVNPTEVSPSEEQPSEEVPSSEASTEEASEEQPSEYDEPNVKISINIPKGWYPRGKSIKAKFKVEDILDTGNFEVQSVKAKVGQNGNYNDVTEDMYLSINENCTVYVLVTDANNKSYERSRAVTCFDTTKPTLNAAISEGLLTIQASDTESGVKVVYVNGYEFGDITNGTVNIRLDQFAAGYEYFNITAMDKAGNVSEVYKTKNPYYKDPSDKSNDNNDPASQLPASAEPTNPTSATAPVTEHTKTDSDGNVESQTGADQKKAEFKKADAEETSSDSAKKGKEFYTVTAASGKNFYLVIDRDGQDEMVYFLTEITENDLLNVTTDNSQTLPKNSAALESQISVSESALPNNNVDIDNTHEVETPTEAPTEVPTEEAEEPEETREANPLIGYIVMAILGAGAIGVAYYVKVVKKKQEAEFVEDEEDDDYEEIYFNEDEEKKEEDFFEKNDDNKSEADERSEVEKASETDDTKVEDSSEGDEQ